MIRLTSNNAICLFIILMIVAACNTPHEKGTESPADIGKYSTPFLKQIAQLQDLPESKRETTAKRLIGEYPATPVIESDSLVTLYWYGKARQVLVTGDYHGAWWVPDTMVVIPCGDTSFFYITYVVPYDARLDYQLTPDNITMPDPRNPVITPSGYGPHSQIAMPGFIPNPIRQYRPGIPHGTFDSLVFTSRYGMIEPRKIVIYLPPGYDALSGIPVIYVLDGLEARDFMSYPTVLDNLLADGKTGPVMAVFIPPAARGEEFMGNEKDEFLESLCKEIVPLIDNTYKTDSRAAGRGITGISAGGFFALYAQLNRPDIFMHGAGQSPTLNNEIFSAVNSLPEEVINNNDFRVYIDAGRYDIPEWSYKNLSFADATSLLSQEMNKLGINHVFQLYNDGHEWANWRERTDKILVYFWGK